MRKLKNHSLVSKNDEFCIQNKGFCIQNKELQGTFVFKMMNFADMADKEREAASHAIAKYERDIAKWKKELEALTPRPVRETKKPGSYLEEDFNEMTRGGEGAPKRRHGEKAPPKLFNKVVQVDGHGERYFYVLTYIPDLFWCRVAPMRQAGVFTADREKAAKNVTGRPRWMLEPEGAGGGELDISASRCTQVKARAVRRVQDADKEEWDMVDKPEKKPEKVRPVVDAAAASADGEEELKPSSADETTVEEDDEMQTEDLSAKELTRAKKASVPAPKPKQLKPKHQADDFAPANPGSLSRPAQPAPVARQPPVERPIPLQRLPKVRAQNLPPRDPDKPACSRCKLGRGVCRKWNVSGHLQGEAPQPKTKKPDPEPVEEAAAAPAEEPVTAEALNPTATVPALAEGTAAGEGAAGGAEAEALQPEDGQGASSSQRSPPETSPTSPTDEESEEEIAASAAAAAATAAAAAAAVAAAAAGVAVEAVAAGGEAEAAGDEAVMASTAAGDMAGHEDGDGAGKRKREEPEGFMGSKYAALFAIFVVAGD